LKLGKFTRIHLTGASGSGTTTLGKALSEKSQFHFIDADDHFWQPTIPPYQLKESRENRLKSILKNIKSTDHSIVSGSVVDWGDELELSFDLVIFLSIPNQVRIDRLKKREIERYGVINEEFIAWADLYETGGLEVRSRKLHEFWLEKIKCPVLKLEGDISTNTRIDEILKFVRK